MKDRILDTNAITEEVWNNPNFKIKSEKNSDGDRYYKKYTAHIGSEIIAEFGEEGVIEIPKYFPNYCICEHCHKAIRKTNAKIAEGSAGDVNLCGWCFDNHTYTRNGEKLKCAKCGKVLYGQYTTANNSSKLYGNKCIKQMIESGEVIKCERCGMIIDNINDVKNYKGHKYCFGCYSEESNVLHSYHTFKSSGNYKYYPDPEEILPMLGFELETDGGNDARVSAKMVDEIFGDEEFLKFETDGSLGSGGFEMISQPAYIGKHEDNRDKYKAMMHLLRNRGYSLHSSNAGLHIHIEKSYFNKSEQIVNLGIMMNKFNNNFIKFSRRTSGQMRWCEMPYRCPSNLSDMNSGRYSAINLTNIKTVEIRLMRSTLDINEFMATLKFISRFVVLAHTLTNGQALSISWDEILGDDPEVLNYWRKINR